MKIIANTKLKRKTRTCPRTCGSPSQGHVPDINNNDNNINIYFNLFNIYKKQIESKPFFEKVPIITKCQNDEEYKKLSEEEREKLFMELMSIK